MQIKKIGKENDEMVTEVQTMEYTPGRAQADEKQKVHLLINMKNTLSIILEYKKMNLMIL